ncbi:MAG: penicillin-binding protein [Micromonosporaceae bacterium]|nr:penicillin-binding protein [Micromonosporaceae bacterium]
MIRRALSATGRVSTLVRTGIVAGVIVAAVAYPVAAISGLGLKAGATMLNELPTELPTTPPAQSTYVYANDGKTLLTMFYEEHRRFVPIAEVSPYLQQAIVASEDARFYQHTGVDTKGIARAFVANSRADTVEQGASTLTMQYVRMALRDGAQTAAQVRAATEQTSGRKLREVRLAVEVEKHLSKPEILEGYLNRAYFGHRAYGVFAAAEIFFSKRPADLTLSESATLAGLVQAPSAYDPASQDRQAATDRRNWVIDRMLELGYVSVKVAEAEQAKPIKLKLTEPPNDCVSVPDKRNAWGFFCDLFRNWWTSQEAFGDNPQQRADQLRRGGYRVVTSLDPDIQAAAQRHVRAKEGIGSPLAHGTVVVEPGSGLVKAMAVNRRYSLDQDRNGPHTSWSATVPSSYPNTVNPLLGGGGMPGYQAGSTFKWFVLLAALDAGLPLSTAIYAPQRYVSSYSGGGGGSGDCGGVWCPQNASKAMTGTQTMWSGFGKSVNTYFVQLQERVGAERAVRMAERLGMQWRSDVDRTMATPERANGWGAFTLGVSDTTPLEMASAYAVGAADGVYCDPLPVLSIKDSTGAEVTSPDPEGNPVPVADPRCRQAVSADVARAATDAARCPTGSGATRGSCGGWSTADQVAGIVGRPVAGKTGTTDNNRTAWFVGFTPELSAASFIADPDNPFNAVGEGNASKPIRSASQTLRDALAGVPVSGFRPPPPSIVR